MKQELYIYFDSKWNLIELMEDTSIPITFNIADISDITKKNSNYSKTITLPGTTNNNKILKHIYNISSYGSFIFDKSYQCYIIDDSQIIFEGYFELQKCIVSGYDKVVNYEAIIYSDFAELFTEMGDYLMRGNDDPTNDLDFSEYDHILNETNIRNSLYTTPGSGYTYIPIDKVNKYNKLLPESNSFYNDELTPCLFIKEIFDKILEKYGYTYDSSKLNSDFFKRLVYPHTNRWLYYSETEVLANQAKIYKDDYVEITLNEAATYYQELTKKYIGDIESQGTNNCYNDTTGIYTATQSGFYNIKTAFNIQLYLEGDTPGATYYIDATPYVRTVKCSAVLKKKSGSTIEILETLGSFNASVSSKIDMINNSAILYESGEIGIELTEIYLLSGDELYIEFLVGGFSRQTPVSVYLWRYMGTPVILKLRCRSYEIVVGTYTSLYIDLDSRITDNCNVPVTQILHKEKQADFFNSIVKMFNLYIQSTGNKHLIIEPRDNFYNLSTSVVDWTNKLDTDKDITIENGSDLRGALVNFKYKYDDDYFNESYKNATGKEYGEYKQIGDGSNKSEYKIELMFAPTPGGNLSADSSMQIPKIFKLDNNEIIDESKEFKPRILYWKGLIPFKTGSGDAWFCYDRLGNQMSYPIYHYPYVGHLDDVYGADTLDLNFAACDWYWYDLAGTWATWYNLTNKYYGNLLAELNDVESKLITMTGVLNKSDIQNLNFYDLIFIDGVHYKLNKINEWVVGEPCKIELLKSNTYNLFSNKPARPSWVRPIPVAISAPSELINIFDANINDNTNINNILDVDITDANLQDDYDVIDANEGLSIDATRTKLYMDVLDANILNTQSVSVEQIMTSKKEIKKINITR